MMKIVLAITALVALSAAMEIPNDAVADSKFFFRYPWIPLPSLPTRAPPVVPPAVCAATGAATAACTCGTATCTVGQGCPTPTTNACSPVCGGAAGTACTCGTGATAVQCTTVQTCNAATPACTP